MASGLRDVSSVVNADDGHVCRLVRDAARVGPESERFAVADCITWRAPERPDGAGRVGLLGVA